jgi:hypothetical protein
LARRRGNICLVAEGGPHGYAVDPGVPVRTLAITVPDGFDEFVAELGEPALHHALPETPLKPDVDTLLAAAAKNGQRILGPPPTVHDF